MQYNCNCIMRYSKLKKHLKDHQLRITDCRIDVLSFFDSQDKALSIKDLEDNFREYDRVTLYRTLNSFEENCIIHKIPDDSGYATYGLCKDCDARGGHRHDHVHFKCKRCTRLECMDGPVNVKIKALPDGYEMTELAVVVSGICARCKKVS